jgi:glucose-6-phosphate isomerase
MHYRKIKGCHLRDLFAHDPSRGLRLAAEGAGLYLDYSKNRITNQTLKLLIELAEASGLQGRIDAMFRGEKVNSTEQQPALHVALRAPRDASILTDNKNVVPEIHAVLDKMKKFCVRVRTGEWMGRTGKRIRNIVNIGVGGAYLGPVMAYHALRHYSDRSLLFRFIANIDGTDFVENVQDLDPCETVFIICSMDLTAPETVANFQAARSWLIAGAGGDEKSISQHFVAVSANAAEVAQLGIDRANVFELWDWVGGRYSLCSAVGLSTMLAIGAENFQAMLGGFHEMDMHFLATPFERNLPVLMGLLAIWHNNLFGAETTAVLPYDQHLDRLPAYLQQLMMESNGKRVTLIGTEVAQSTGPVCVGEVGINGQYSFYQLIHQGTRLIPCDFIAFAQPSHPIGQHHDMLMANVFAQTHALAFGKTSEQLRDEEIADWLIPHRECTGNRPSNTILAARLTPDTLGKLIALYEHSIYTQGVIWNIDSFDQWGIEHGKEIARDIVEGLQASEQPQFEHDSSTNELIRRYRSLKSAG